MLSGPGDALVWVPAQDGPDREWPLILLLHGAGGNAEGGLRILGRSADEIGAILVAPASRASSWDVLYGGFGPDVETIDHTLEYVFDRYSVDPHRLIIAGFSDGASYALSLGITNGDLFSHVVAFSPGFVAPEAHRDKPAIFISHGIRDEVLPIDSCSRRIVPVLRRAGYQVTFIEFDGSHVIPAPIASKALTWAGVEPAPQSTQLGRQVS